METLIYESQRVRSLSAFVDDIHANYLVAK